MLKSIGQRALEAWRVTAAPSKRAQIRQRDALYRQLKEAAERGQKADELLYMRPDWYKVIGQKPGPLSRLIHAEARMFVNQANGKADWKGVDPRIKLFGQKLQRRFLNRNMPFHVQEAYRTPERQAELYAKGVSKVKANGKHTRGLAIDFVHSRFFWELTKNEWASVGMLGMTLAEEMKREAEQYMRKLGSEGIIFERRDHEFDIRWGGDWDRDGEMFDEFWDPAHWELKLSK